MELEIALVAVLLAAAVAILQFGLHKVPEGTVGVYYRGGALMNTIAAPGYHMQAPFITRFEAIQVNIQTDLVRDIPCGTNGGTVINFEKIEVVNRLDRSKVHDTIQNYGVNYDKTWIYDKIHHEINQFCSGRTLEEVYISQFDTVDEQLIAQLQKDCTEWNTGIEIISIRVTKPRIPDAIRSNFEAMEAEKTRLMVANQTQKVVLKEAETDKMKKIVQAQKRAEISVIEMKKRVAERTALAKTERIADEMHVAREKAWADAEYYRQEKLAEGNLGRLTRPFLEQELLAGLANATKTYYGRDLSKLLLTRDETRALLSGAGADNANDL
jgi:regulator of protease activity HflC (stomatin/prohibitin superfamily)